MCADVASVRELVDGGLSIVRGLFLQGDVGMMKSCNETMFGPRIFCFSGGPNEETNRGLA
nr:hypothetical protein Q903MT_gene1585 [Picea sitchensis]